MMFRRSRESRRSMVARALSIGLALLIIPVEYELAERFKERFKERMSNIGGRLKREAQ